MSKLMDDADLYVPCWGCNATRKTRTGLNHLKGHLPIGSPCPLCLDGYFATGMKMGDFKKAVAGHKSKADAIALEVYRLENEVKELTEQVAYLVRNPT